MAMQRNTINGGSFLEMEWNTRNRLLRSINIMDVCPQILIVVHAPFFAGLIHGFLLGLYDGRNFDNVIIEDALHGSRRMPRGQKIRAHIIIGTPGIILDYAQKYQYFELSKIKVLIVAGVDKLIPIQGYPNQVIRIRRKLVFDTKILLFSQTESVEVNELAAKIRLPYLP
ncbi:ATP-dependent RNA helicase DDX19A-like [Ptychodera flava]|uniref:ATP-dependent RNA helicase DDX19A-like n=1 Tax=Ptychodera flava TaxID=63121 RepID=UPI003969D6F1